MARDRLWLRATRSVSPWLAAETVTLLGGVWILLVAGTRLHEMLVGGLAVVASGLFLRLVHRHSALAFDFAVRDLVAGWRIPWYVLSGCYEITTLLLRDAFTGRRAESLYRVSGFFTREDDPLMVSRRVLATAYTTAAPNFIVIGIDPKQSRMLFHQIERSSVPKMTQELGAKA